MDERTIQEMTDAAVAKYWVEYEAAQKPTPDLEQRLTEADFRERIAEHALLHGVRPTAVRHVVRDAAEVFTVKDGGIVPRGGATDPHDPLSPLTPARWLQELAKTEGYLFTTPGHAH